MCDECNNAECRSTVRVVDEADAAAATVGVFYWLGYLVLWVPARLAFDLVRRLFHHG